MSREERLLGRLREATVALRAALDERDDLRAREREPLAIVGLGCRFPGGADGPEAFRALLDEGRDAVGRLEERWRLVGLEPSAEAPRWAGLIDDVERFDAGFFGISHREARSLDPQQRLLLEVAWETLEDAGIAATSLEGSRSGVFVGAAVTDYLDAVVARRSEPLDAFGTTGNMLSVAAGRLAYTLSLEGPCLSLDTACSSSLVAVHLACRSLRQRECDLALAGGVNVILSPATLDGMSRTQALSRAGRCRTFDAAADGYVRGEGCGLVALKRLTDAVANGDRIWAVIRGSAIQHDGRGAGLMAPNVLSQQAVLRAALDDAGAPPEAVGFVETHGAATSLGDPIEVEALREVVGRPREDGSVCRLGAVKSNLGHLEAAAGVAGLIKAVLALDGERIPQNLHFRTLNPRLRLRGSALALAEESVPWPRGKAPRLAGVSSFGLSGTNAHVVLAEAPGAEPAASVPERSAELFVLSAQSPAALNAQAARLRDHLERHPEIGLGDLGWSLLTTRSQLPCRLALSASSRAELSAALAAAARGETPVGAARGRSTRGRSTRGRSTRGRAARGGEAPQVVFVFPGQGSQWPQMGCRLLDEEPVFRAAIETCDAAVRAETGWSLVEELTTPESRSRLGEIDVVQPCLFAVELALAELLRSWGVEPDMVVGHSMGEVAAARIAGGLTLEDAARVICRRSRRLRAIRGRGAMAMVELAAPEAERAIAGRRDRLSLALINSPRSTVLAGDPEALDEVLAEIEASGVFCRRIKVDVASHSPQVDPLEAELRAELRGIAPRALVVPMCSTVTGEPLAGPELGAEYWWENLRRPVRFDRRVEKLAAEGPAVFVELSPHPVLLPAIVETLGAKGLAGVATGSLHRERPERFSLLAALGTLWVNGLPLAVERLYPTPGRRVPLPTYAFQRERFWLEGEASRKVRRKAGSHPLLGEGWTLSTAPGTRVWELDLSLEGLPWLADHRVRGTVVFPGAGYLEMAVAAAVESGEAAPRLSEVRMRQPLVLDEGRGEEGLALQLVVTEEAAGRRRFAVASRRGAVWMEHCTGVLERADGAPPRPPVAEAQGEGAHESAVELYARLGEAGLEYGPAFRGVVELRRGSDEAFGRVRLPEAAGEAEPYHLHPALLDACFHVVAGAMDDDGGAPWVLAEVGAWQLFSRPAGELRCHIRRLAGEGPDRRTAELWVSDEAGAPIARVSRLGLRRLAAAARPSEDRWFVSLEWETAAVPEAAVAEGRWLIVGEGGGLAEALRHRLEARGHEVTRAPVDGDPAGFLERLGSPEPPTGVVHLGSLDGAEPEATAAGGWISVLAWVQALTSMGWRDAPRLVLVTRGARARAPDAAGVWQAPVLGLGRTVALEHPELRCLRLDLEAAAVAGEAEALTAELLADDGEDEVMLGDGERRVARLLRRTPEPGGRERPAPAAGRPFRLASDRPGVLDRLALRPFERRPPEPGEVEIEVEAAALNFVDVLEAMGRGPEGGREEAGAIALGRECSGRIVAVGPGVEGLEPGREVMALARPAFATHVRTDARLCRPRPERLDPAEGAAQLSAYTTAWYALAELARLRRGERVLIHSASGGTGLAAVEVARLAGADVFLTAGSAEKRRWLRDRGFDPVLDSRSLAFAEEVRTATGGRGVDVVLNSLSGEAIEAGLSCLAPDGRFVELGKSDVHAGRGLGLGPFRRRLAYFAVDMEGFAENRPERMAGLLEEVASRLDRGELPPLPIASFPVSRAAEAFREVARARHVGKLVLTLDDPAAEVRLPSPGLVIRAEATYLLTGGLGALGLSAAAWLVERGARHLVLIGRSGAASEEQRAAVAALETAGAGVQVAAVDVADRSALARVLDAVPADRPLRGVLHAAGGLDDGLLAQQTVERFRRVMDPKVQGSWNLHRLTRRHELDFFVLYSSSAGLLGSPGQANYAAANAFLGALAHHRRAAGLPALAVDWGAFAEVGLAAAEKVRGARLAERGLRGLTPSEGLRALERLLQSDATQAGVLPVDLRRWAEFYPAAAGLRVLSRVLAEDSAGRRPAGDPSLLARLAADDGAARRRRLEDFLIGQVHRVLQVPEERIEREAALSSLGLDSLMGLELRNRLEAALGITLSVTLLFTYPTVATLAAFLAEQVAPGSEEVNGSEPDPPRSGAPPSGETAHSDFPDSGETIADEEEILALLDQELDLAEKRPAL